MCVSRAELGSMFKFKPGGLVAYMTFKTPHRPQLFWKVQIVRKVSVESYPPIKRQKT